MNFANNNNYYNYNNNNDNNDNNNVNNNDNVNNAFGAMTTTTTGWRQSLTEEDRKRYTFMFFKGLGFLQKVARINLTEILRFNIAISWETHAYNRAHSREEYSNIIGNRLRDLIKKVQVAGRRKRQQQRALRVLQLQQPPSPQSIRNTQSAQSIQNIQNTVQSRVIQNSNNDQVIQSRVLQQPPLPPSL